MSSECSSQESQYWQIVEELENNGWKPDFNSEPGCIVLMSTSQNNLFPSVCLPPFWKGETWSNRLIDYELDGELTIID